MAHEPEKFYISAPIRQLNRYRSGMVNVACMLLRQRGLQALQIGYKTFHPSTIAGFTFPPTKATAQKGVVNSHETLESAPRRPFAVGLQTPWRPNMPRAYCFLVKTTYPVNGKKKHQNPGATEATSFAAYVRFRATALSVTPQEYFRLMGPKVIKALKGVHQSRLLKVKFEAATSNSGQVMISRPALRKACYAD